MNNQTPIPYNDQKRIYTMGSHRSTAYISNKENIPEQRIKLIRKYYSKYGMGKKASRAQKEMYAAFCSLKDGLYMYIALHNAHIMTLHQLSQKTKDDIINIKGFGYKRVKLLLDAKLIKEA